jgi:hypothetical protein
VDQATARYLQSGFTDNVFFLEVRNHGFPAALVYLLLLGWALVRGVATSRRPGPGKALAGTLTAGLVAGLVLHLFDNYLSESVFMKSGFWLLIGALVGWTSTQSAPSLSQPAGEPDGPS